MPEIILTPTVIAWITFALAFSLGLMVKEILTSFVLGFIFRFNGTFKEGDQVFIDNKDAVIVSIGWRYTKFGIDDPEKGYLWRFVPNDQIKYRKIEKLVRRIDQKRWNEMHHPHRRKADKKSKTK